MLCSVRELCLLIRWFEDDLVLVDQSKLVLGYPFYILRCILVLFQLLYLVRTCSLTVDLLLQLFLLSRVYIEFFLQSVALHTETDEQNHNNKTDAAHASVASPSFFSSSILFHPDPCFFLSP